MAAISMLAKINSIWPSKLRFLAANFFKNGRYFDGSWKMLIWPLISGIWPLILKIWLLILELYFRYHKSSITATCCISSTNSPMDFLVEKILIPGALIEDLWYMMLLMLSFQEWMNEWMNLLPKNEKKFLSGKLSQQTKEMSQR